MRRGTLRATAHHLADHVANSGSWSAWSKNLTSHRRWPRITWCSAAGLRGLLPIIIGGEAYELQTLTANRSDEWLRRLALALADVQTLPDPEDDQEGAALIIALLTSSTAVAIDLIRAYDLGEKLGNIDLGDVATKLELKTALMAMVTVEDPFGEAAGRSAAAALGERSQLLGRILQAMGKAEVLQRLAQSTNGHSAPTDSTTDTSPSTGATNSEPSDGPTRTKRKKSV